MAGITPFSYSDLGGISNMHVGLLRASKQTALQLKRAGEPAVEPRNQFAPENAPFNVDSTFTTKRDGSVGTIFNAKA